MFGELPCGFAGVAPGSVCGIRPFPPGTDRVNPPPTPAGLGSPLRHCSLVRPQPGSRAGSSDDVAVT